MSLCKHRVSAGMLRELGARRGKLGLHGGSTDGKKKECGMRNGPCRFLLSDWFQAACSPRASVESGRAGSGWGERKVWVMASVPGGFPVPAGLALLEIYTEVTRSNSLKSYVYYYN